MSTEKKSETSELIDLLRRAIVNGEYKPRERLIEKNLAEKYHVSRTPIREALKHLAAQGMVLLEQYKGAVVADYDPQEIEQSIVVRGWLEGLAGNLAATSMSDEELKDLAACEDSMESSFLRDDVQGFAKYNEEFHHRIYRGSGNTFLYNTISLLLKQSWHEPCLSWQGFGNVSLVIRQHQEILKALQERNPQKAQEASCRHTYDAMYLTKLRQEGKKNSASLPSGITLASEIPE